MSDGRDPLLGGLRGRPALRPAARDASPLPLHCRSCSRSASPGRWRGTVPWADAAAIWFTIFSRSRSPSRACSGPHSPTPGSARSRCCSALPTGALLLATGGVDIPVVTLLLATAVLVERGEAGRAGVVVGWRSRRSRPRSSSFPLSLWRSPMVPPVVDSSRRRPSSASGSPFPSRSGTFGRSSRTWSCPPRRRPRRPRSAQPRPLAPVPRSVPVPPWTVITALSGLPILGVAVFLLLSGRGARWPRRCTRRPAPSSSPARPPRPPASGTLCIRRT